MTNFVEFDERRGFFVEFDERQGFLVDFDEILDERHWFRQLCGYRRVTG